MGSTLGMGYCPLGFSLFGYGSPSTAPPVLGRTLELTVNGPSGDARKIDPYTRDYDVDANGLVQGQSAIAQQVFLAILTTLGSSINPTLGSQFGNIKTWNPNTIANQMTTYVQQALSTLIKNGSISLVNVQASLNPNGVCANVTINWINNFTKQVNQTVVTP
jgi:phage gp46-like protein